MALNHGEDWHVHFDSICIRQYMYFSQFIEQYPKLNLQPLDGVLRAAARMIGGVPKFGHISEFMRDTLHWLPVHPDFVLPYPTISVLCFQR